MLKLRMHFHKIGEIRCILLIFKNFPMSLLCIFATIVISSSNYFDNFKTVLQKISNMQN